MPIAIFGISNNGLNLAVSLFVLALVVVWLALIVYTFLDSRRRMSDPVLVACATAASLFPYIGTIVYVILRPPEFIEDARERELEIKASELRVRQLSELSCPNCEYPVEKNFLRCPNCQRRLKDPCPSCGKPVDPRWALCPYCENALPERARRRRPEEEAQREPTAAAPPEAPRRRRAKPEPDAPTRSTPRAEEPSAEATPKKAARSQRKSSRTAPRSAKSEEDASEPRQRKPATRRRARVPESGTGDDPGSGPAAES